MKHLSIPLTPAAAALALVVLGLTVACLYPVHEHGRYEGRGPVEQRGPEGHEHEHEHGPEYRPL